MKTKDVMKLSEINRYCYWIKERHRIYLRRQKGLPGPWTDDHVLQTEFFTNPYRENDKTTVWFRENIRERLRDSPEVVFATICFRWFNYIPTGELLIKHNLLDRWHVRRCISALQDQSKIFTGAYLIKSPTGMPKLDGICECVQNLWRDRQVLCSRIAEDGTLEGSHALLKAYPYQGPFMSYEIITDLRHTYLLQNAEDINTWANPGPGCRRGLIRMAGGVPPKNKLGRIKRTGTPLPSDYRNTMTTLLTTARKKTKMKLEMREIEHSLCEWDKYERVLWKQGRSKRHYKGE